MQNGVCHLYLALAAATFVVVVFSKPPKGGGGGKSSLSSQECFLLRSNDTIALTKGFSTYLEIGNINVGEDFSMAMDVLPSPLSHNGILLSIGSEPNFGYYEWKTKAVNTQFLVVEFIFSALALTVKALNTEHLQQIEVYKTYPVPYKIDDARWHSVKVTRTRKYWRVQLDNLNVTREISVKTNVLLQQKPAFIGGRPRYIDHQFQGVIRNVKVNGRAVHVKSKSNDLVDVMGCSSNEASLFIGWIKGTKAHIS